MRLDPVTLEILGNKVAAATEEMCFTLQRTGRTLYVKETADFACALAGIDGHLLRLSALDRRLRLRRSRLHAGNQARWDSWSQATSSSPTIPIARQGSRPTCLTCISSNRISTRPRSSPMAGPSCIARMSAAACRAAFRRPTARFFRKVCRSRPMKLVRSGQDQ